MGKKKRLREQRDKDKGQQAAEKAPRSKPWLARLYDRIVPGEYTRKQDIRHMLGIFAFIAICALLSLCIWWNALEHEKESVEATLTIPSSAFVEGQQSNVRTMLEGYGFKNIRDDENGNILADGTSEMVQKYENSFHEKMLTLVEALMAKDHTDIGVESVQMSDDGRTLTISTYADITANLDLAKMALGNEDIDRIVSQTAIWCQMRNDGEKQTVKFFDVIEKKEYYSSQQPSGNGILAELEAAKRAEQQDEDGAKQGDDSTSQVKSEDASERESGGAKGSSDGDE